MSEQPVNTNETTELIIDDEEISAVDDLPLIEEPLVEEEEVIEPLKPEEKEPEDIDIRKDQNVIQEMDINSVDKIASGDEITLPSNFDKETRKVLEKTPNINLLDNPQSRDWANAITDGLEFNTLNEAFVPTLEDNDSEFRHKLEHSGISLNGQAPKFKQAENLNLKGERAIIRLISHLGLGTLYQAPLWHSGLWVTFKPPSESEIIELNRTLMNDKIRFGRYSYGLMFSNMTVYTTDKLVDFALAHVYDITSKVGDISIENLKEHVSCQDIPSLLWGFICTMYPKGFKYRRACVNDPEKCNHILSDTLNVSKLQWTNVKALTEWQKTFMSARQSKIKDLASITRYKEELSRIQTTRLDINKDTPNAISIILKTPNVSDYISAGHTWIGNIVNTVEKTLGMDSSDKEKNNLITQYGQASAMRQYSHWIESIEYDTNIINDRETIELTLDVLSSDDEIRTKFTQGVLDYINSSTISVIGIPVYDCPQCQKTQESPLTSEEYKNIIPLDVLQLFFGLLTQRVSRVTTR